MKASDFFTPSVRWMALKDGDGALLSNIIWNSLVIPPLCQRLYAAARLRDGKERRRSS